MVTRFPCFPRIPRIPEERASTEANPQIEMGGSATLVSRECGTVQVGGPSCVLDCVGWCRFPAHAPACSEQAQ